MPELLRVLQEISYLKVIKLQGLDLSDLKVQYDLWYLLNNDYNTIEELSLKGCRMTSSQFDDVCSSIANHKIL